MTERGYAEQARHYREAAWDRGCTCPSLMAPHTHLLECPLYETPSVPGLLHDHGASPAAEPSDGMATTPREGQSFPSPSLGAGDYLEHLDQQHDADEGRPWL